MNNDILKKFSDNLKKVLVAAEKIAADQNIEMSTEHQLMGLTLIKETLAYEILTALNITFDRLDVISKLIDRSSAPQPSNTLSTEAKNSIQLAVAAASKYGHFVVDTEHLLLALTSGKEFNAYAAIERLSAKPEEIKKQIEMIFSGIQDTMSGLNSEPETFLHNSAEELELPENEGIGPLNPFGVMHQTKTKSGQESLIHSFSTNLTNQAAKKKLDPVIGREKETERLIQILCRRTKNNPILIGEPGIGKTAIVEGLAQKIIDGHVPEKLAGKEILSLDMGSLLAGTMYRGQFESRVKKILNEIKTSGNIILFVDEIHTVVGAGSTEGSIDAANLLKPMLARGELRLIGSTTIDEYKKHIEKDPAFERRFQPILVKEATKAETLQILRGIQKHYEIFHGVKFTPEAIKSAVDLSTRYISDRFQPDKAIDLIDEAAAAAANTVSETTRRLAQLRKELRQVLRQKEEFIMAGEYEKATKLREYELIFEEKIKKLKSLDLEKTEKIISTTDIAKVVARWTGVPVTDLTIEEKKRYLDLEKRLKEHIIGQDEAVTEVAKTIRRARVGIANPKRPSGSFIFLGPTGVGKTELAKVLAEEVLGSREALIKIDMSEFMERHNVSRLIGAPAGYIGYEEGGKLTEAVKRKPYSVILFDEIEKAHPEVFNILLQIMEDGELNDARGQRIDFKNTILIMTSNLGTNVLDKQKLIGFAEHDSTDNEAVYKTLKENAMKALEDFFRPEFLNRVDKVMVFRPLSKEAIDGIINLQIAELAERLAEQNIKIVVDAKAKKYLAEKGFNPDFGARPIRKAISDFIEDRLAEDILAEKIQAGDTIRVSAKDGEIIVKSKILRG